MKLAILGLSVVTIAALLWRERRRTREAAIDGFAGQVRAMVASPVIDAEQRLREAIGSGRR